MLYEKFLLKIQERGNHADNQSGNRENTDDLHGPTLFFGHCIHTRLHRLQGYFC